MKKRKQIQPRQWESKFEKQALEPGATRVLKGGNGNTPPPPEDDENIVTDDIIDQ